MRLAQFGSALQIHSSILCALQTAPGVHKIEVVDLFRNSNTIRFTADTSAAHTEESDSARLSSLLAQH